MSERADAVLTLLAEHLMIRDVRACTSEDHLVEIMQVMTLRRIRHLPVVQNGALQGIVRIGDVVKQPSRRGSVRGGGKLRRYIRSS